MPRLSRRWVYPLLVSILALAFGARSLNYSNVFLDDGSVIIENYDGSYHARLVHYAVAHFPRSLAFDPYLNHPEGARVPWPPLYDWLLALVGWLLGSGGATVERILAWASPVLASLAVFPVYAGARTLTGRGPALGAAAIYALLPIAVTYSRIGNPDHHAWLALLSALYLALSLWQAADSPRVPVRVALGLVVVRVFVTLSWSGSLLYLLVGEAALLIAAVVCGNRRSLDLQSWGCALAALLVAPVVALSETPLGGWFSASALSWLQVLFLAGTSIVATGVAKLESRHPSSGWVESLARSAGLALGLGALALLLPPVREGLAPALSYVSKTSGFFGNPEQLPLYAWMRGGAARQLPSGTDYYGGFAYITPLPLLAAMWATRDSRRRSSALILSVWILALGPLAIFQLRWGNDFAPAAAVGFALALVIASEPGTKRPSPRRKVLARVSVVFMGVMLSSIVVNRYEILHAALAVPSADATVRPAYPSAGLVRFANKVHEILRKSSSVPSGESLPKVGIMAPPRYGHVLHYVAESATPADNFGPQFNLERYRDVLAFFETADESKAVEIARRNATRFVMTERPMGRRRRSVSARLHAADGSADSNGKALGQFRLVAEAELGAVGLLWVRGTDAPYKLFELVEGAELQIDAAPHSIVTAGLLVRMPEGREFRWRTSARTSTEGRATLRVPYASNSRSGVGGIGPYRVVSDGRERSVSISENHVRQGAVISLKQERPAP